MRQRLALVLAGSCLLAASCSADGEHANPTQSGQNRTPLVAETALPGLLLSAAQINAAVGGTELAANADATDMTDHSASVSRPECIGIFGPGEAQAFAGSGWSAFREQPLRNPDGTQWAVQSVVLFPTAEQAAVFYTASSTNWRKCQGSFINISDGGREVWDVGPISEINGVLSVAKTMHPEQYGTPSPSDNRASTSQRVLTVRDNVVIDVDASTSPANQSTAVHIVEQIAARIPKA
ncbi:MAG: hypothetical protein QOH57_4937 [Mycobacterium sp.]|nr:hypothetical protein [Mycobacterium sp.]